MTNKYRPRIRQRYKKTFIYLLKAINQLKSPSNFNRKIRKSVIFSRAISRQHRNRLSSSKTSRVSHERSFVFAYLLVGINTRFENNIPIGSYCIIILRQNMFCVWLMGLFVQPRRIFYIEGIIRGALSLFANWYLPPVSGAQRPFSYKLNNLPKFFIIISYFTLILLENPTFFWSFRFAIALAILCKLFNSTNLPQKIYESHNIIFQNGFHYLFLKLFKAERYFF